MQKRSTKQPSRAEFEALQQRLEEAEDTLRAIKNNEVDALLIDAPGGQQIFTLKGAEQPYRILMETMSEGTLTMTIDGMILYSNSYLAELIKIPLNNLIGASFYEFVRSQKGQSLQELLINSCKKICRDEFLLLTREGTTLPVSFSAQPLRLSELEAYCIVITDLTEQKRTQKSLEDARNHLEERVSERTAELMKANTSLQEEIAARKQADMALRASEERFRALTETSSLAVGVTLPDGEFLYANKAYEKLFGCTLLDLNTMNAAELWRNLDDRRKMIDAMKSEGFLMNYEVELKHKDGTLFWALMSVNSVDYDGNEAIMASVLDITARKQAAEKIGMLNEQLKRQISELNVANKELDSFAYSISHDLQAPIRAIRGMSDILMEDYSNKLETDAQDYLNRIASSADKAQLLITDILNLSKISTQEIILQQVDLSSLAASIIKEFRQINPAREIELMLQDNLKARGDERLLKIAILNLLDNAWKYTLKCNNARVEIGSFTKDSQVVFFVRDNGVGFDMAYVNKLFAPFQRLHPEKEFPGSGIGLAIVKRVIEKHSGAIWAQGEPGKGATFYFTLPCQNQ